MRSIEKGCKKEKQLEKGKKWAGKAKVKKAREQREQREEEKRWRQHNEEEYRKMCKRSGKWDGKGTRNAEGEGGGRSAGINK